jgi:DNA-binding MarR family transcriptional regulator
MGELASSLVLDRSALAHNLKPLERDGLVQLNVNKEDKRRRHAVLTHSGRKKLIESKELWRPAQARFEAVYGAGRAARLRKELRDIAEDAFAQAFGEVKLVSPTRRAR